MALGYTVIDPGYEVQFIEINRSMIGLNGDGTVHVAKLDTLPTLLANTVSIAALRAYWDATASGISLGLQAERQIINAASALIAGTVTDIGGTETGNVHRQSHVYILPPGLSECVGEIPSSTSDLTMAQRMAEVKNFEIDISNYIIHSSSAAAFRAYRAWKYADEATEAKTIAAQGYFKNPAQENR